MHNFGAKLNISTSMLPEKNVLNCLGDNYLARVVPGGAPPASTKYPPSSHAGPNLRSQINMRQFTPPHHRVFTVPVLRHLGGSFGGLRIRHLGGSFGGHRIRHLLGFGSFEFLAGSSLELELGRLLLPELQSVPAPMVWGTFGCPFKQTIEPAPGTTSSASDRT